MAFFAHGKQSYNVFDMNGKFMKRIDVVGDNFEADMKSVGFRQGTYVLQAVGAVSRAYKVTVK